MRGNCSGNFMLMIVSKPQLVYGGGGGGGGGYCNRIITFNWLCIFLFQNSAVNLEWIPK